MSLGAGGDSTHGYCGLSPRPRVSLGSLDLVTCSSPLGPSSGRHGVNRAWPLGMELSPSCTQCCRQALSHSENLGWAGLGSVAIVAHHPPSSLNPLSLNALSDPSTSLSTPSLSHLTQEGVRIEKELSCLTSPPHSDRTSHQTNSLPLWGPASRQLQNLSLSPRHHEKPQPPHPCRFPGFAARALVSWEPPGVW